MSEMNEHAANVTKKTKHAARDVLADGVEHVKDIGQGVGKVVKEQVDRVSRGVRTGYRSARASGQELEEAAQSSIRHMPITTVLVAAGVGALLGYALGRASTNHHG
ncbi:MAG TPA: hypothetical protein VHX86_17540 [Tepidisphaeraceae bacterium]|jgi:ElaB/YqjD/DUF883 family membrane-anchored ribosome-binding protein|nr:hypothetical protein [Tepidisphaeraceae bacterium]